MSNISDFLDKMPSDWVRKSYEKFYKKNGYIPQYFDVYNSLEVLDTAPSITTRSNGAMGSGTLLILEISNEQQR